MKLLSLVSPLGIHGNEEDDFLQTVCLNAIFRIVRLLKYLLYLWSLFSASAIIIRLNSAVLVFWHRPKIGTRMIVKRDRLDRFYRREIPAAKSNYKRKTQNTETESVSDTRNCFLTTVSSFEGRREVMPGAALIRRVDWLLSVSVLPAPLP